MATRAFEAGFDAAGLDAALAGTRFAGKIRFFESIHSTNTHAMAEGDSGAPDGMVYVADEQTAGRGRGAHGWESPPGSGLYVSVLLRPRLVPADALWLSLAAGLAVHDAVARVASLDADLRWPNDLLFGRRKFCGILSELNAEVTRIRHMVIGIGINVHQQQFPPELRELATSLYIETGRDWPRQELLAGFATIAGPRGECTHCAGRTGAGNGEHSHAARAVVVVDSRQAGVRGRARRLCGGNGRPGFAGLSADSHA